MQTFSLCNSCKTEFYTTSLFDDHNAGLLFGAYLKFRYPLMKNFALQNSSQRYHCALSGLVFVVHSLPRGKERTNENRFRQAEIASLLVSIREQANIAAPGLSLRDLPFRAVLQG